MKQSAAKTLTVAALGTAVAAAGAGAANAAPGVPAAPQALGTVTQALPAQNVSQAVPAAGGVVTQGQSALGAGLESAQPTTDKVVSGGPTNPAAKLLGGLPVKALSGKGKGVGGLPLGGAV
ncbi:ATP-binding protein [Streptomyces acidicola]|uniref:ATP-binding protein n=1 Tax=Streptomyces acidicola TaxID=2596892 RepID=A0A5N8X588_9ACTN|nr:ATP-binding protein [Streptomyces acidicola]MPY54663.1 ATP-binding protein [Streptomyces acidicola]